MIINVLKIPSPRFLFLIRKILTGFFLFVVESEQKKLEFGYLTKCNIMGSLCGSFYNEDFFLLFAQMCYSKLKLIRIML